jgi:hypothetical protein
MRKFFLTAFVLSAMLVFATSSFALEKTSIRATDDSRVDGWNASTTCAVWYYNFCTGWLWAWSGWGNGDILGVCYDTCCPPGFQTGLNITWHDISPPTPAGYGFTGSMGVYAADANCCPTGAPIAAQPWLPTLSRWNSLQWGCVQVPNRFVLAVTMPGATNNPTRILTDHPAAGPTGPQACGFCYPNPRVNHTFYYGTAAAPYCPGTILTDGVCGAELEWEAWLCCMEPIGVEENSWGSIKNLYR